MNTYAYIKTYIQTFIAAIIHNSQTVLKKKTQRRSTNKWIKKIWYVHITEYYSDIKRNYALIHRTRVKLNNTMKRVGTKGHILYDCIFYGNSIKAESILAVARGPGQKGKSG